MEFGFYGMLQSLLNLFVPIPNYLFLLLRKKNVEIKNVSLEKNYFSFFLTFILFIPTSIIALFLEFFAIIFNRGGVLRIVMKKI